ncbi:MAG TPA: PBP1A family penicillin-binding protein [Kofleriaceae bacterium]|nr:PBP1A family penicillin-binding protein [Kofleriaceae bacterium]
MADARFPAQGPAGPRKPRRRKRRRRISRFSVLRFAFLLLVYGVSLAAATLYFVVDSINRELPQDLTQLLDYKPYRKSVVLATDGDEIGSFSIENRKLVTLDRMPPHVPAAFLSAEDRRFYQHGGFDPLGIVRAAWKNFRSPSIKQGGSTITQQILKQTLLANVEGDLSDAGMTPQQLAAAKRLAKYRRKMMEVVLSVRLERELTKAEILQIYLNHVYLGHGAYGVGAAAQTYFGKEVEDLTIAEAAMLAGLVASPTKYAPTHNIDLARERQRYVLGHMRDDHYISESEYQTALVEPIALVDESDVNHLASPYFVEHVRRLATQRFGNDELFAGGLHFYATLDAEVQRVAEDALRHGLESLDRKLGFRGPIGNVAQARRGGWTGGPAHPLSGANDDTTALADQLLPEQRYGAMIVELPRNGGVVVDLGPKRLPLVEADAKDARAWASKDHQVLHLGDLLAVRLAADGNAATLAQRPSLQGSVIVMDPHTGRVLALVGGYDWTASQFDRATQAKRQVGSSIKPFIYSAALEAGKTPVDHLRDGPFSVQTATGTWTPANYDNKYLGDVTIMTALAFSLNTISVQLAVQVGLDRIIEIMRGYGITSPIPRHISISLGTPDLTPLEVATGYAGIANGGRKVTPRFYDLVTDAAGHIVDDLRNTPAGPQVVSPAVDYVMINLMKGVVQRGTARYASQLGRPTAGKTGTSANYKDVWFNGFTTDLLCSVWIGRDDSTPIGDKITGGGAAVPIWLEVMQKAHPPTKIRDFAPPPNVSFARVEPWGGDPDGVGPDSVWMPFVRGTLPASFLAAPPLRSFDDVVAAPPVPPPPARCTSLSCL